MEKNKIAKIDPAKQFVFGWASIANVNGEPVVDSYEHVIPSDELEQAVYQYNLWSRSADEKHTEAVQGQLIESIVFTKEKLAAMGLSDAGLPEGWWVGFYIFDRAVFEKVVSGEYEMFSIAGTAEIVAVAET